LPWRHGGDAGHFLDLALGRDRVRGLRRRGDQHQIDLVLDDQILCDFGGAVRIGLTVLHDDLDRHGGIADLDASLRRFLEIGDDEIVGLGKGCERPGER